MKIKRILEDFTVCKVRNYSKVNLDSSYCFIGKTEEENSLVCLTKDVPSNTTEREDGWKAFRVEGVLDFSLVGILSDISSKLAKANISVFAVSTFNTDYILVNAEKEMEAMSCLAKGGYEVMTGDIYGDYFMNRTVQDVMQEYGDQQDEWK